MVDEHRPALSVFAIRHAPTAWNVAHLFMGQQDVDVLHVSDPTILPIARAGRRRICCSPLRRAGSSAAMLFPGEKIVIDQRLSERAVGEWEGLDHATVEARWPDAFADGVVDPLFTPPGGEPMDDFKRRVASFLEMLLSTRDESAENEVYVVTHNGWIRVALLLNGNIGLGELFAEPVPFLRPIPLALNAQAITTAMRP